MIAYTQTPKAEQTLAEWCGLEVRLSAYEKQFDMLSQEFYRRLRSGKS